jgi:hypothetical protein
MSRWKEKKEVRDEAEERIAAAVLPTFRKQRRRADTFEV